MSGEPRKPQRRNDHRNRAAGMSRRARALTGTALLRLHERSADRALSREAARVVGARHAVPAGAETDILERAQHAVPWAQHAAPLQHNACRFAAEMGSIDGALVRSGQGRGDRPRHSLGV